MQHLHLRDIELCTWQTKVPKDASLHIELVSYFQTEKWSQYCTSKGIRDIEIMVERAREKEPLVSHTREVAAPHTESFTHTHTHPFSHTKHR